MDFRQYLVMIGASLPTTGLIDITDHEPRKKDNKRAETKSLDWIQSKIEHALSTCSALFNRNGAVPTVQSNTRPVKFFEQGSNTL